MNKIVLGTVGIVIGIGAAAINTNEVSAASYINYITTANLNIRAGMGTGYSKLGILAKGTLINGLDQGNGWTKITYKNRVGYISSQYLKVKTTSNKNYYEEIPCSPTGEYITTANLNIRSGMGTGYKKIGLVPKGKYLLGHIVGNGWAKICYYDDNGRDTVGFVSSKYLKGFDKKTNREILPRLIIVNKSNLEVTLYKEGFESFSYYCAIGKSSTPTPSCKTYIKEKVKNRPYYDKQIPGGSPNNPLGTRWIGLAVGSSNGGCVYALHGTNDPNSIGKRISGGCVRGSNAKVQVMYDKVQKGDIVLIGTGTDYQIAAKYGYKIY